RSVACSSAPRRFESPPGARASSAGCPKTRARCNWRASGASPKKRPADGTDVSFARGDPGDNGAGGMGMRPPVLSLLARGACTSKRTEVVIGVATNLDAPTQMSSVLMTVSRDGVPLVVQTWDLPGIPAGRFELPGAFGVYTDDGSEPRIEVELVGQLG